MTGTDPFWPINKIQQFVVQFACRIPIRKDFTTGEKKTLENLLRELDPNHFQLPAEEPARDPACLFQMLCQHEIGASIITSPSFIFSRDSFSFFYPIRLTNNFVYGFDSIDTQRRNVDISGWANRVLGAVNSRCQRAGKIYLMVLGPFEASEKTTIFQKLCTVDLSTIGEFNFTFTFYQDEGAGIYNLLNNVSYMVPNLPDRFFINVKVDINNRRLRQGMEPPDIQRVWDFADRNIYAHLKNILTIT